MANLNNYIGRKDFKISAFPIYHNWQAQIKAHLKNNPLSRGNYPPEIIALPSEQLQRKQQQQ